MRQTPLSRLIEVTLAVDLREHLISERAAGKDWRSIAADLTERSGHSVSHESVRSWLSDEAETTLADAGSANPAFLLVPVAALVGLFLPYSFGVSVGVLVSAIAVTTGLGARMLRGRRDRVIEAVEARESAIAVRRIYAADRAPAVVDVRIDPRMTDAVAARLLADIARGGAR